MSEPTILTSRDARGVMAITLNRPEARNALDEAMITALADACEEATAATDVRAVVLSGNGPAFCAGADIGWMERLSKADEKTNREDAERFARMLEMLSGLPQPLIGVVQGASIGGGVGLVAACDAVIAAEDAFFQFREVRIGLAPATIAPLVARSIGAAQARYLFLTARRIDARRAAALGLVHEVVPAGEPLERALSSLLDDILAGGPNALRAVKTMMRGMGPAAPGDMAGLLAELRRSDEACEGFRAFHEKRKPVWTMEVNG